MGRIIRNTISYGFVTLLLAALGFGIYLFLDDLDGPEIVMTPDTGRISPTQDIALTLTDAKSGVRSVSVTIHRNNQSLVILDKVFAEAAPSQSVSFNLKNAGLRDGAFELEITARDDSLMSFGKGNGTTRKWNMQLDTQPPKVRIRSTVPALRRGSVTAIAYSVSEDASMTGVRLGDRFFPAFLQPNGLYYCFIPFPLDTPKSKFSPELITRDLAGNESRNRVLINAGERNFRKDTLNISDRFLDGKEDVFKELIPDAASNLERYIRINNEVRLSNEQTLLEVGKNTVPTMLWSGSFKRLPGSASRASFGDQRTYLHNGTKIDEQIHMGQDLASVAHAPVPAANDGKVVFAEPLGIFGNLVIIDHGLGLQSLYSHMSEIQTSVGATVKKGDIIGLTGTTGLAGGDHLHFGILLHGIQVQPLDWFDAKWIKNTITDRLEAAGAER